MRPTRAMKLEGLAPWPMAFATPPAERKGDTVRSALAGAASAIENEWMIVPALCPKSTGSVGRAICDATRRRAGLTFAPEHLHANYVELSGILARPVSCGQSDR